MSKDEGQRTKDEEHAIAVNDLTKRFGHFVSVDRVSFTVDQGEVFGFLGPNGAGKSTTIRMLCGLLEPTSGEGRVAGFDITRDPDRVKAHIGYMSQRFSLYEDLTPMENLLFYGGVYGLSGQRLRARVEAAVEMAGIADLRDRLTHDLPGGWKQRLALGCALLHEPKILFLDEPTGGVDPLSRRRFWELIDDLADRGVTVFVTTHFLDEAEYCRRIGLINAGRLAAIGTPHELRERFVPHPVYEVVTSDPIAAMTVLEREAWVRTASIFGTSVHVEVQDPATDPARIVPTLTANGLTASSPEAITPSLEDVFLAVLEQAT
ncbi:MAG: ABC transporter ATP-binding protein [Candidatus Latescibacteria bacterium]|nr:ABC transporter ATP-binding protein [Candidatus Latescibacterota bacterium]